MGFTGITYGRVDHFPYSASAAVGAGPDPDPVPGGGAGTGAGVGFDVVVTPPPPQPIRGQNARNARVCTKAFIAFSPAI